MVKHCKTSRRTKILTTRKSLALLKNKWIRIWLIYNKKRKTQQPRERIPVSIRNRKFGKKSESNKQGKTNVLLVAYWSEKG